MVVAVADTHALIWALLGDPRLSPAARAFMSVEGTDSIGVSAIVTRQGDGASCRQGHGAR